MISNYFKLDLVIAVQTRSQFTFYKKIKMSGPI